MANFCRKCGAKLNPGAKFCGSCGEKVFEITGQDKRYAERPAPARKEVRQGREQRRAESAPDRSTRAAKPGQRGLCVLLSLLMVVELCVAGFKYPGFFRRDQKVVSDVTGGSESFSASDNLGNSDNSGKTGNSGNSGYSGEPALTDYSGEFAFTGYVREFCESLGMTEEDLRAYYDDPIEVTPENSPGNPAFIEVSYTDAERAAAPSQSAAISRENPEADFSDFGIHVDLKWWNLDSESDTLTVKKLPVKTDAVTGMELYTYDCSLGSGQHEFHTPVLITIPIEGDPDLFEGALHHSDARDEWEELYYELSDDGKNCIVHTTHFSDVTLGKPSSSKTEQMKAQGEQIRAFYRENGQTLFRIMPYEDVAKYPNSHTWLYGIGLTKMPNLEQFMRKETLASIKTYEHMMKKSGGVPAEAGEAEAYGALGTKTDAGGSAMLAIGETKLGAAIDKLKVVSKLYGGAGHVLSALGLYSLYWRIVDQWERGVGLGTIFSSNAANFLSAGASAAQLFCAGMVALGGGTAFVTVGGIAAGVGACFFCVTKMQEAKEDYDRERKPLGNPVTLEEAAYHYFLTDYAMDPEKATKENENYRYSSARIFNRLMQEDWTAYDDAHHPGRIRLDIRGNGWAEALDYLFQKYKDDPKKLAAQLDKLYNSFIDQFWSDEVSSGIKYDCWKQGLKKVLSDGNRSSYYRPRQNTGENVKSRSTVLKELGITEEELTRREILQNYIDNGKTVETLFDDGSLNWQDYVRFSEYEKAKDGDKTVHHYRPSDVFLMKKKALGVLYKNTNPIVYGIYRKYYEEAMRKQHEMLYKEALPWLNTRVTFYMQDARKGKVNGEDTKYDMFDFECDDTPLFDPANADAKRITGFGLNLICKDETPVLLETNVYHYLRFGCPTKVKCTSSGGEAEPTDGKAIWDSVDLVADPESMWNALPEHLQGNGAGREYIIKDLCVPILFTPRENTTAYRFENLYLTEDQSIWDDFFRSAHEPLYDLKKSAPLGGNSIVIDEDGTVTVKIAAVKRSDEMCSIERDALTLKGKVFRREDNGVFIVLESWPETFRTYCTYQDQLIKNVYPSKTEPGGTREISFTELNFKMSGAEFIEFDRNGGVKKAVLGLECLIDDTKQRNNGTEDKKHYPTYDDGDPEYRPGFFILSSTP